MCVRACVRARSRLSVCVTVVSPRTLRHLHLSNTHIRNQGQDKLIDALKVNNTILSISLTDTSSSRASEVSAVEGLLMKNRELERVREEI